MLTRKSETDPDYALMAFRTPAVVFGSLLLLYPFVWMFSLFLLMDTTTNDPDNAFRVYVSLSAWAYPLFYIVSLVFSFWAYKRGSTGRIVLGFALIPMLSGYPWILIKSLPLILQVSVG